MCADRTGNAVAGPKKRSIIGQTREGARAGAAGYRSGVMREGVGGLGGSAGGESGDRVEGVLRAASVGRALSPSASVVVPPKSDFLAYYC
jgi:hypothetical protein